MTQMTSAGPDFGKTAALFSLLLAMIFCFGASYAAEIKVLSTAALGPILKETAGEFERTSGHKLAMKFDTGGAVTKRLQGGESADVVIVLSSAVAGLAKDGKLDGASAVPLAKSGVGIAVRAGAPKSKIASVDDLKQALLAAKTVSYADPAGGGAAGIHVAGLIQKMGIADQLKPKLKLGKGGDVTEVTLAQGDGAIGMTQISEIIGKPGAELLGPLPESVQSYTAFSAAVGAGSKQAAAAGAFIKFLKSPSGVAAMKAKGMQPG